MALFIEISSFILALIISVCNGGPIFWINKPMLFPEATRYYPEHGFFASSTVYGTIYHLETNNSVSTDPSNPINFTAKEFYSNENLKFSAGFEIDFDKNILFICHANPNTFNMALDGNEYPVESNWSNTYGFMGGVMIVDLNTKQVIIDFDFADYNVNTNYPMFHFPNDIVLDSMGNAYVTDSFGGAIYKISYNASNNMSYTLSIFSTKHSWSTPKYAFFDGISLDRKNESFLLVNCWIGGFVGNSVLFKIPINNPMNAYMVNYTNILGVGYGFDGQVFSADGEYLYVTNSGATNTVYQFASDDNWDTMTLIQLLKPTWSSPTAVQLTNNTESLYVSSARFNDNNSAAFPIELLDFSRNNNISSCSDSNDSDDDDNDGNAKTNDSLTNNDIVFVALIAVSGILLIALIISIVCACKLKKQIAYHGSNLDYHDLDS